MPRPVDPPRAGERIAKLLARAGIASRREIERMIAEGRVARDGVPLTTPATVLASLAGVTVDGEPVAAPEPARLFLYHKPPGLLVTEHDPRGRPTIYDRLAKDLPRLVPVGRLDLNTEGLLLLTTDGGFKRELELPSTGVERAYRARVYGAVSQPQLEALIDGIEIDGIRYGSIDANMERRTGANSWIELVLTEGKNREVRRVLEYLGLEVSRLIRIRYGPFVLGDLPPGAVGEVRDADLAAFRHALASKRPRGPERVSVSAPATPGRQRAAPPKRLPGADRGPVATRPHGSDAPDASKQRSQRPPRDGVQRSRPNAPQLGPSPRRGTDDATPPPRPAKIERKPGWARAKPKAGPRRPRTR